MKWHMITVPIIFQSHWKMNLITWALFQLIFELVKNGKTVSILLFIFHALVKTWKGVWAYFFIFHDLDSNMKKYWRIIFKIWSCLLNLAPSFQVEFYLFSGLIKPFYEKYTVIESSLKYFQTLKMWKYCRVKFYSSQS